MGNGVPGVPTQVHICPWSPVMGVASFLSPGASGFPLENPTPHGPSYQRLPSSRLQQHGHGSCWDMSCQNHCAALTPGLEGDGGSPCLLRKGLELPRGTATEFWHTVHYKGHSDLGTGCSSVSVTAFFLTPQSPIRDEVTLSVRACEVGVGDQRLDN